MTRAVIDNDIIGVNEQNEIVRENPVPVESGDEWHIPYVQNDLYASTQAITVNTRNRSEFGGTASFAHMYWSVDGIPWSCQPPGYEYGQYGYPLPLLPGQVWPLLPGQWLFGDFLGRGRVSTNTADATGAVMYEALGDLSLVSERDAAVFCGDDLVVNGDFRHPVLPANGGTKKIKFTVSKQLKVKITEKVDAQKLGATVQIKENREGVDPLPVGEDGYITIEPNVEYEMTLTGETKEAGEWANVLAEDNVKVEFGFKREDNSLDVKKTCLYTVFWVVLDVDPLLLKDGNEVDPSKDIPDEPRNHENWKLKDLIGGEVGSDKMGFQCSDDLAWGTILVRGKILPSGLEKDSFKRNFTNDHGFNFKRMMWSRCYINNAFAEAIIPSHAGRLNYDEAWDEEMPTQEPNWDEDLFADKDDGNDLYIYQIDAPRHGIEFQPKENDVFRCRIHAMEWVYYDNQICSDGDPSDVANKPGYKWSLNYSTKTILDGGALKITPERTWDVCGDNKVIAGTWRGNLGKPVMDVKTPPVPFNPKKFTAVRGGSREKEDFEIILQSGAPDRIIKVEGEEFPEGDVGLDFDILNGTEEIGISNEPAPARESETEISATLQFGAHGTDKPGDYRVTLTITIGEESIAVTLLFPIKVIGKVVSWELPPIYDEDYIEPTGAPNTYRIWFLGLDALGHHAKGDNAPPVEIDALIDPLGALTWLSDSVHYQYPDNSYTGYFLRIFVINATCDVIFWIDVNDGEPSRITYEYMEKQP